MKVLLFLMILFFSFTKSYAQFIETMGNYRIYDIKEYNVSYLIYATDSLNNTDTFRIIANKEKILFKHNKVKLEEGKVYTLQLYRIDLSRLSAQPSGKFSIRINEIESWVLGRDDPKDIPYCAKNIKDLYLNKKP